MPERFKHRILQHVTHKAYEPRRIEALADELQVDAADREDFAKTIAALVQEGQVVVGASETVALPPIGREIVGRFRRHERGFGFLIPDVINAHGDLFVPAPDTGGALTNDRVRAAVVYNRGRSRGPAGHSPYTGRIVEIIKRADTKYVGTLQKRGKMFVVAPDGRAMTSLVVVRDPHAKHANEGDKVVVEITHYAEGDMLAEGVITEVLGEPGAPAVETQAICRLYDLAEEFPEEVVDQARTTVQQYESQREGLLVGRTDISDDYIITIDPPNAQDYDDAISITHLSNGDWELGVHIADVAAFVIQGTPLDAEAYKRGNSAYLPRKVVPMLPEVLSNGICSLQPGVPRLTRSAFMTYDAEGNIKSTRFARTLINSSHRLTYIEAQALIDGDQVKAREHAKYDAPYTDKLIATLKDMNELSSAIRARRLKAGMIVLELPEVELVYDAKGRVVDAQPEDDSFTHKVIEAFMVEANEAVARVFADLDIPLIRRCHPEPSTHDVSELRAFASIAGYQIPQNPTRKELQHLLDTVRGTPAAKAVHFAVLRTLTRATYGPELVGHFALASEHYTHFTSPIRRYPDLSVHRAMDALLAILGPLGKLPKSPVARKRLAAELRNDPRVLDFNALRDLGRHCSQTERNAEAAERELRSLLVLQLLEAEHMGDIFDGTVTGVTGFGVYVQIDKFVVDGMIKITDLPGAPMNSWRMIPGTGSLRAERSGHSLTIGDQLKVQVNKVDLARRQLDLRIVDTRFEGMAKPKGKAELQPGHAKPEKFSKKHKPDQRQAQGGKTGRKSKQRRRSR
jgi:ribonuclease R